MHLERLLAKAARLTWRHRSWWALGLSATIGSMLANLALRGVNWYAADRFSNDGPGVTDLDVQDFLQRAVDPERLVVLVVAIVLVVLSLWLVSAAAEGGLILAVAGQRHGIALGPGQAWRAGAGLLGRFVGVDTLLFLPLFLLALALMGVGFGGLAGLVLAASRPAAQFADLLLVAGLALAISLPLVALLLAGGPVIMLIRTLAFRAAALEDLEAGDSIRRAWRVLRRGPLDAVILALVLAGVRWLTGLPLRLGSLLAAGLAWGQVLVRLSSAEPEPGTTGLLLALSGVLLAFVSWLISAIMNAFSSAAWTQAYQGWVAELE